MAPQPKQSAPPPPPPPPAPVKSVAVEANKNIAAVKTGKDPLRPLKYARKFVDGTIVDGLDGMAKYGRKGLWVGIGLGIIAAIATGGLVPLFACAIGGFALGAGGGTLKGVLTGGMNAVGREHRAHLYADDLVQRKKIQNHAAPNPHDYRTAYRNQQLSNSYNTQQLLVRDRESTHDFNTYWQDREAGRRNELPQERGLGY